jgi:hypothetical protein
MSENSFITTLIDTDNTVKINYVILFFIFVIGLSNNIFRNMFGQQINGQLKSGYVKHSICIFFLFLLLDMNPTNDRAVLNPVFNIIISATIYLLVLLLMHSNQLYISFILAILFIIIVIHKFKSYFENTINDQEILQGKLDMIYKTNNVFIVIIILIIIIGSLTSLDIKSLINTVMN